MDDGRVTYEKLEQCRFDGRPCPADGGCGESFNWKYGTNPSISCCRHPDKAQARVDDHREWVSKHRAVPDEEWEKLDEEMKRLFPPDYPDEDGQESAAYWFPKRNALLEKYNPGYKVPG
jgi:hypothetical protein